MGRGLRPVRARRGSLNIPNLVYVLLPVPVAARLPRRRGSVGGVAAGSPVVAQRRPAHRTGVDRHGVAAPWIRCGRQRERPHHRIGDHGASVLVLDGVLEGVGFVVDVLPSGVVRSGSAGGGTVLRRGPDGRRHLRHPRARSRVDCVDQGSRPAPPGRAGAPGVDLDGRHLSGRPSSALRVAARPPLRHGGSSPGVPERLQGRVRVGDGGGGASRARRGAPDRGQPFARRSPPWCRPRGDGARWGLPAGRVHTDLER